MLPEIQTAVKRQQPGCDAARHYAELMKRLESLPHPAWHVKLVGLASGYPFFAVRREVAAAAPTILLTGGMLPVADSPRLDGRRAQGPGWVFRLARRIAFERRRQWPLAFHLTACCADHFRYSKTPTRFSLSLRVSAHLAVLQEALGFVTIPPLPPSLPVTHNPIQQ